MAKHVWFNPGRFLDLRKAEQAGGMHITVELSPYETPQGVVGQYVEARGIFRIDFLYIDREPAKSLDAPHGITISQGKHTGKLLSIEIPVDEDPHDKTCVIELQTKLLKALEEEFGPDERTGTGFELNLDAAKSIINNELPELVLN